MWHARGMSVTDADIKLIERLVEERFGDRTGHLRWTLERGLASVRPPRDGLTGCWGPLALRRGHLLGLPALRTGDPVAQWLVHALAIDVRGLNRMNDQNGYLPVDHALVRLTEAMKARFPDRAVIRSHGDAFAAIRSSATLTPSERSLGVDALRALEGELLAALRGPEDLTPAPERLTLVELDLELRRVRDDAELVGTLVHAEIEAALWDERRSPDVVLRRRTIELG